MPQRKKTAKKNLGIGVDQLPIDHWNNTTLRLREAILTFTPQKASEDKDTLSEYIIAIDKEIQNSEDELNELLAHRPDRIKIFHELNKVLNNPIHNNQFSALLEKI